LDLIFPLLPVADARAGFKVGGCLSLIEHSDRALWAGGRHRSRGSEGSDCVPRRRAEFG